MGLVKEQDELFAGYGLAGEEMMRILNNELKRISVLLGASRIL